MKKILCIAVIAVFGLSNVSAQDFKIGVKSGVNFSTFYGDDTNNVDGRTAFHLGLAGRLSVSDVFSIQPELIYSAQGAKTSEGGIETVAKLDYINLPVLADFTVAEGFSLQVGPQFGFLINDKVEVEGISVDFSSIGTDINSFDLGAAVGAQYKFPEVDVFLQARYVLGLSDQVDGSDSKNSVFSLSVGYFFL